MSDRSVTWGYAALAAGVLLGGGCSGTVVQADEDPPLVPQVYSIRPGPDVQYRLQGRLIEAVPGDVIQLEEGRYELRRQIDVVADNVTIRGRGSNKTILSFKGQVSGSQGIEASGDNFVIEGLAVEDTAGNAIKVLGARNVTFSDVRTEWTGEAESSNGAYGIYPVQCRNVLIEDCTAIGASDAGLYVGQSRDVVVRNCRAERNVAGIEIENTVGADVYDNVTTNNAGGILIFDLPGLPVKNGRNVRVYRNQVTANNHANFAAPGNIVATVPPGTGVMILATDRVEVFENEIADNQSVNLAIVSFLITERPFDGEKFDAIPDGIHVHDNRFSGGGTRPSGEMATLLAPLLGKPFPDILFDGAVEPQKVDGDAAPRPMPHRLVDNGDATFANFNFTQLTPRNILTGKFRIERDLSAYTADLEPLSAVTLAPHDPPARARDSAVRVYRSLPKKLSEFGLFKGNGSTQQPAEGVVPYDLNTPLFSDYTAKHRFIRVPEGKTIVFREDDVFDFPVGTIISKTFSYPHDMRDATKGERLLETRIELLRDDGWYGFTYIWNDEQTEATLALGGGEAEVSWIHTDGTRRTNSYEIPNANQCLSCHSQGDAFVPIGPTAANLNRSFDYPHGNENQLAHMTRVGVLRGAPEAGTIEKLPQFDDPHTGSVAERARAWLHVNCAHCHSPAGSARTSGLDLRLAQDDPARLGVWKSPIAAGHGSGGRDYDIVPGKPDESILVFRLESTEPSVAMPNVSRRLVPEEAVALVRQWIEGITDEGN